MKKSLQILIGVILLSPAFPARADHGRLATNIRDSWINLGVDDLVSSGLAPTPGKPIDQLTNLEVAQLTAQASQKYLAQADLDLPSPPSASEPALPPELPSALAAPPPLTGMDSTATPQSTLPSKSMTDLVSEFRKELTAMGVDVDKLEQRIVDSKVRNEVFAALQKEYLKRTGTDLGGFSRGFVYDYRGFGTNAIYPAMEYNAAMFMEWDLKSIPIPTVLFDARMRLWRSMGMYYQDPFEPAYQLRWISLTDYNDFANFTAGDFFKSYTPLTLWNYNIPVYTFIDPTSFYRTRKDTEELAYVDHGPDWHMRGFQASASFDNPKEMFLSGAGLQAMVGTQMNGGGFNFSSYYGGAQGFLGLFNDFLTVKGTGLILTDDVNTANTPYLGSNTDPNQYYPDTFPKEYQIGSLSGTVSFVFSDKADLIGNAEGAVSRYYDDLYDTAREFQDWAILGNASLDIQGAHFTGKYINNGPNFYSPGAQTNRYTPAAGSQGYWSTTMNGVDDALPGYLNGFLFQGVNRPYYAPYDRLSENFLPYGDASPNRKGIVLGFWGEFGEKKWLKPQASYLLNAQEIQPNYVLNPAGTGVTAVDGMTNARVFGGYEGALTLDIAKAIDMKGKTYDLQLDYKHQTTDLGMGGSPFTVNTMIGAVDFNIPVHFISRMVWSVAFEQAQSTGSEFVLGGGSPPTLASYAFYLDPSGQYSLQAMNITRDTIALGGLYPISDKIGLRCDWFFVNYKWTDNPAFDRRDQIWRLTYEAHF